MNQTQLAELAGLSTSYLSQIERGKRDPNLSIIKKIAEALNIPFSILMFLAADKEELESIDSTLAGKITHTVFNLIGESKNT